LESVADRDCRQCLEYNSPFLLPDELRLYFISDQAQDGKGEKKDFDIWYLERQKDGWSELPINASPAINTKKNEYYMSFTDYGTIIFLFKRGMRFVRTDKKPNSKFITS